MSNLNQGAVVLRLEFSIADAVHQRGLFPVLGAAINAWFNRPRQPANAPPHLRADVGLEPEDVQHWHDAALRLTIPLPLQRPGM
jgi:hypothetical protein